MRHNTLRSCPPSLTIRLVCALRDTDDVTTNFDNIVENAKDSGILFNPPLGDNQAFKMAASGGVSDVNIQYSDYFAGVEGPAKLRYQEKITVYGFDPYALRKSDFFENIELV